MRPPERQGLYDPANEHDACGVGFVANIKGRKSHEVIEAGLQILVNLDHRGAVGADPRAGDGAGILVQIPHKFFAKKTAELGFKLIATRGTAVYLRAYGLDVDVVFKVNEGRPNVADEIVNRKIDLIVNTPLGRESFFDDRAVRRAAMMQQVPCITTLTGAAAAVAAIRAMREQGVGVRALQDYYAGIAAGSV